MKTVSLAAHNRPEYLRSALHALRENRPGERGYTLVASLEPGCKEVVDMVMAVDFMPLVATVNAYRLGLCRNLYLSVARAFSAGSDFNVYLEEDVVFSPDALCLADTYFDCRWMHTHDSAGVVFCTEASNPSEPNLVSFQRSGGLINLGFGCTRAQWGAIYAPLWWEEAPEPDKDSWDRNLSHYFAVRGYPTLRPHLNRARNIGLVGDSCRGEVPSAYSQPASTVSETRFEYCSSTGVAWDR